MKCAVFHDYFGVMGGGERVALVIARTLGADILTTDTDYFEKTNPDVSVRSLGRTFKIAPFKQISAEFFFSSCNVSDDYDLFIFSGNWAHHAGRRHHPNIWYCHTPVRVFYDLYDIFRRRQPYLQRQAFVLWASLYRYLDQRSVSHVDSILTNSKNTLGRIQKYYQRDAGILYPPVDTSLFYLKEYGDFWLSVNRLYPVKRIELQIEAFRNLPDERLVIIGGGGGHTGSYYRKLNENLPSNVELRGEISDQELIKLYSECRGFITTAYNEDFGITPVEAMAAGKPVIAVREGGYLETLIDGTTGFLVPADISSFVRAIRTVSRDPERFREACLKQSKLFDLRSFQEQLKQYVRISGEV